MASEEDYQIPPLARAFLRQEYDRIDPKLEKWMHILTEVSCRERAFLYSQGLC